MKDIRHCSIYCFTNLINNKKYIGSTIQDPKERYRKHLYNATHEDSPIYNYPLYNSIRKRGIENYKFEIIFEKDCTEKEIREIEHDYIIKYNTLFPNGYNQTDNTQNSITPEITLKVKEALRNRALNVVEIDLNNNILNEWRSIEDCAEQTGLNNKKIAAVCRGERHTTSDRIFRWLDQNNNIIEPEYKGDKYKGAKETTQIQSTSRQVAKIDIETKKIIQIYPTIALAARENNCNASIISQVCRGKRKTHGGFIWEYFEAEEKND